MSGAPMLLHMLLVTVGCLTSVEAHGRLTEPPSRASMWRFGFDTPHNYNDNQLFCGGRSTQWDKYGGKCGVCGDSFAGPREHEAPSGKYAKGVIVRKYQVGQEILVRVHLTANHKGWFEFRLCQNDDPRTNVSLECFDKNLLADKDGKTRFEIVSRGPEFPSYKLVLPPRLSCRACVLQWKYNAGNSWGKDFETGEGCSGCGPQEQFYACSDVAIGHADVDVGKPNNPPVIPPGDVDETKAWEEEAKKDAAECYCPCLHTASAGSRHTGYPVAAIFVLFFIVARTV